MTPEEIDAFYALRERVARETLAVELAKPYYDEMTEQQAYDDLHATSKTEKVTRLIPLTIAAFKAVVSRASMGKFANWHGFQLFADATLAQNRERVGFYLDLLESADIISMPEKTAGMAFLESTETVGVTVAVAPRIATDFGGIANFPNKVKPETFAMAWADAGRA